MLRTLAVWAHPLAGFATITLATYQASLGLRARSASPRAAAARRRHARIGPWLYAFVLTDWLAGLGTMWAWRRPEYETAESGHFAVGSLICAVFTAAALLSRSVPTDPRARRLHPIVGAVGILLCGVQIFLGLQLLP